MNYNTTQYGATVIIIIFAIVAWTADTFQIGYGKHISDYVKLRIPPRIGWILYECPNILWISYYLLNGSITLNSHLIPIILFTIHYLNRDLIYPFTISQHAKSIPIEIVVSAIIYTSCNGYLQVSTHIEFEDNTYTPISLIRIAIGICIFVFGMVSNIQCDYILRNLKKGDSKDYKIPNGNLFEFVSSGHYLAEIIEWFGYWVVSGTFSGFLFFAATLSILSARAVQTHIWYKQKFPHYPPKRRAIIPFIL